MEQIWSKGSLIPFRSKYSQTIQLLNEFLGDLLKILLLKISGARLQAALLNDSKVTVSLRFDYLMAQALVLR